MDKLLLGRREEAYLNVSRFQENGLGWEGGGVLQGLVSGYIVKLVGG